MDQSSAWPYLTRGVSYGAKGCIRSGNWAWMRYKNVSLMSAEKTLTLRSIDAEDGHVRSDGTINPYPNVGDTSGNLGAQAFLSFDISGIPAGSTILDVVVNFSDYDTLGDPFGSSLGDGCLRAYPHDYGTLGPEDYFAGWPTGAIIRWCSTGELDTPTSDPDVAWALKKRLGSKRFQLRLQFKPPGTDKDRVMDVVQFGTVKLKVAYQTP